jgi:hypothetical protein
VPPAPEPAQALQPLIWPSARVRGTSRKVTDRDFSLVGVLARVHGGYARMAADGAAGGRPVLIVVQVRWFRCRNPECPAVTFAEQARG